MIYAVVLYMLANGKIDRLELETSTWGVCVEFARQANYMPTPQPYVTHYVYCERKV